MSRDDAAENQTDSAASTIDEMGRHIVVSVALAEVSDRFIPIATWRVPDRSPALEDLIGNGLDREIGEPGASQVAQCSFPVVGSLYPTFQEDLAEFRSMSRASLDPHVNDPSEHDL